MRVDEYITLRLVSPLRRAAGWVQSRRGHHTRIGEPRGAAPVGLALPVLMYHQITDQPEPGVHPYYRVRTSPRRFEQQLQWLADAGYRAVTLTAGLAALAKAAHADRTGSPGAKEERETARAHAGSGPNPGQRNTERLVVLTFDDGFRDFQTTAFPRLQRHGFTATVFLATAYIGESRRHFHETACLTWDEVRALQQQGIEFGSHTVTHPVLYGLPWHEIETELIESKRQLESALQTAVTSFAYPYAFPQHDRLFVRRFGDRLRAAGYRHGVTTTIGRVAPGDDAFSLKRLPVNNDDHPRLFRAKLAGAYDWLEKTQSWVKQFKRQRGRALR